MKEIVNFYLALTESKDSTFCTGIKSKNMSMPSNFDEQCKMNTNANDTLDIILMQYAQEFGEYNIKEAIIKTMNKKRVDDNKSFGSKSKIDYINWINNHIEVKELESKGA